MFALFNPKTDTALHAIIEATLCLRIPNRAVCPGHSAPFDFIADSFFERVANCLIIGPRTGGKTVNTAALEFMESIYKNNCNSCHLGAIIAQAERAYKYIAKWTIEYQKELKINSSTRKRTIFGNGAEIEIVVGTVNGVNSPHPNKATIDEFELVPWEIFQEAISMPCTTEDIIAALRLATTRKYSNGNAQKMIQEANKRGFKIYKWCVFEIMQRCTKKGTCKENCSKYKSFTRAGKEKSWDKICGGKAKRSNGYLTISDVIQKFILLDWEVFEAQWLCKRPERSDSVFQQFSFDENVISRKSVNLEGVNFGRGWDYGYDDPTAVLFFAYNDIGDVFLIDEIIINGVLINDVADMVLKKSRQIAPEEMIWEDWGDPSGKARTGVDGNSYTSKLSSKGIEVNHQYLSNSEGIQLIQKKIKKSNFTGKTQFYVTENCIKSIDALELSQWDRRKGDNAHSLEKYRHDVHSHPLDALRYFIAGIFGDNEVSF